MGQSLLTLLTRRLDVDLTGEAGVLSSIFAGELSLWASPYRAASLLSSVLTFVLAFSFANTKFLLLDASLLQCVCL